MSDYPTHQIFPLPSLFLKSRRKEPSTSEPHYEPKIKDRAKEKEKEKEKRPIPWRSWLYQSTFVFWIALIIVLLGGSAWGLSEQALRAGRTRWNIFLILAAYVFLFVISVAHLVSRRLSIKRIMRTMPKPYVPTKAIDLPNSVADHIMVEYSRTAVIAHISQATKGYQEGWGRPGTKWENQHFRTYILSTLPKIQKALPPPPNSNGKSNPNSLSYLLSPAISPDDGIRLLLRSYVPIVEKARYARGEPSEEEAAAVESAVDLILLTMEVKKLKERGEG